MSLAIDISNYSGDLGARQLLWLRENAQLVIVRLSTEDNHRQRDIAAQQVYALSEAAIPWQGYLWAYWEQDPYDHWMRAQEKLPAGWPGYHKLGIWLDMEDNCTPATATLPWIGAYASLLRADGFVPCVYTGLWWVRQHAAAFEGERGRYWAQYPLWWASYGVQPDCRPASIGPWQELAMHQYESVDHGAALNSYDVSLICNVP